MEVHRTCQTLGFPFTDAHVQELFETLGLKDGMGSGLDVEQFETAWTLLGGGELVDWPLRSKATKMPDCPIPEVI